MKPLRTNADFMSAIFRRGVASIKAPENAPDEIKELLEHVQASTLDKMDAGEAAEKQDGTVETTGEEVD